MVGRSGWVSMAQGRLDKTLMVVSMIIIADV